MSNEYQHVTLSRRARMVLLVIVALALVIALFGIIKRKHHDTVQKQDVAVNNLMSVKTVLPMNAPDTQSLELPGSVTPWYEATVFAQVDGYLKMWYTDIGAQVKKGQTMAVIDTPELDEQIQRAQSDLATAQAKLDLANVTAVRWQKLLVSDSVSQQEVDEKVQGAKAQQAELNAAKAYLRALKAKQAFNHLVAPFDGVVTDRNTDIGMLITTGSNASTTPLFRVADVHKLRVYVDVPQNFSQFIKPGLIAQLTFPDIPGKKFTATYFSTSESIHATSRTLTVELTMDNPHNELQPGAYTNVYLDLPGNTTEMMLPATSLLFRKEGLQVATVGPDNKVVLKSVVMGRDMGKSVVIRSGILPTDQVIDSPSDSIANGDKVVIVNKAQP